MNMVLLIFLFKYGDGEVLGIMIVLLESYVGFNWDYKLYLLKMFVS